MDLNGWSPNGPELKVNKQTVIKIELERKHQKFNNSQSKRSYGIRVAVRDIDIQNDYIPVFIRAQRNPAGFYNIILLPL